MKILAIVGGDGDVAREYEQRRARAMGDRDVHDHVGEAGAFSARTGGDFAGAARKTVGGRSHGAFRSSAESGNASGGNGVDDLVIAGAAEKRGKIFILAGFGENLGARHAAFGVEGTDAGGLGKAVGDVLGKANGGDGTGGGGEDFAWVHERGSGGSGAESGKNAAPRGALIGIAGVLRWTIPALAHD